MERTKSIFDWVFGVPNTAFQSDSPYKLYYMSCNNTGLSDEAVLARKEHEAKGKLNVETKLSQQYTTLRDVWKFLNTQHDFYSALKLAIRAQADTTNISDDNRSSMLKASYGGSDN